MPPSSSADSLSVDTSISAAADPPPENLAGVTLPDEIFSDIMMMVGLESLDDLHRCRQVSSQWNKKISRFIWGSERNRKIMTERIEKNWGDDMLPTDEEISHAKWLSNGLFLKFKVLTFFHFRS